MPAISHARKAAFQILLAVERGQSHSDDLLRGKAVNELSSPDRNLATALVLGVIRWQIRLDHELQALLKRPNAKLDPEVRIALRMGAFQLRHLDRIPARAAIDESVELAKQAGHRFASGMVNAVLRKFAKPPRIEDRSKRCGVSAADITQKDGGALEAAKKLDPMKGTGFSPYVTSLKSSGALAPEETPTDSSAADLALAEAHPAWMVERWATAFGLEAARDLCRHGQSQPLLTIRIGGPAVEEELAQAGIELAPGELLTSARTVLSGDVTATAAFSEGRCRLQDEGSQLVAEIAGQGSGGATQNILDCCAAPGGKTLILGERNQSARIVACESSAQRFEQLQARLAGFGERVECRHADAAELAEDGVFDLALADVPCSGTGTLGRNPEIRHRLKFEDLARQATRQRAILSAALRAVRAGGSVVYSTCSLEPEENEQVVEAVLAADAKARQISLASRIEGMVAEGVLTATGAARLRDCLTPSGALRLLPGVFHTDGFFIAMMEKTALRG